MTLNLAELSCRKDKGHHMQSRILLHGCRFILNLTPSKNKTIQGLSESSFLSCCFTSTEAGWPIRDGDRVGRGQGDWLDCGNRPKKTGETVDRRQNNGSVKAVSPRHCPATCALCNCSFNCCAGQSLRQCPLHRCWWTTWTTRSKRRPTCSAQLHLPTNDLFWAKVRVQLHLPPLRSLDLLISPGALTLKVNETLLKYSLIMGTLTGRWLPTSREKRRHY